MFVKIYYFVVATHGLQLRVNIDDDMNLSISSSLTLTSQMMIVVSFVIHCIVDNVLQSGSSLSCIEKISLELSCCRINIDCVHFNFVSYEVNCCSVAHSSAREYKKEQVNNHVENCFCYCCHLLGAGNLHKSV